MKAVVLVAPGGVENFRLTEVGTPLPGAEEVRIQVKAAGFNPSDYKTRESLDASGSEPVILGGEVAGVIDAVGASVGEFQVGDGVCAYLPLKRGGYAEVVCTPTAFVARKPDVLSFTEAAVIPLAGLTALTCIGDLKALAGKPLFIAGGAGGVGGFALELARVARAYPIVTTAGTDSSVGYLADTLKVPLDRIIRYDRVGSADLLSFVCAANGTRPYQTALDFVGGHMTTLCCEVVDFDGCVTSIVQRPRSEDQELLSTKSAAFRFVGLRGRAKSGDPSTWLAYRNGLTTLLNLVSARQIRLPKIEDIGALSDETVRRAHRMLEGQHVQGKLVMSVV
jgi:NADPH:quinone reductase